MQSFGLIGLIIVIAVAAWWFTSAGPVAPSDETGADGYSNVLDRAKGAADSMERDPTEQ